MSKRFIPSIKTAGGIPQPIIGCKEPKDTSVYLSFRHFRYVDYIKDFPFEKWPAAVDWVAPEINFKAFN